MARIYIANNRYIAIRDFGDNILDFDYDGKKRLIVDELMALPIECLLNKGYRTTGCCAGHAIATIDYELVDKEFKNEDRLDGDYITEIVYKQDDDATYACLVEQYRDDGPYIDFEDDYFTKISLPEKWKYEDKRLETIVPDEIQGMHYYKEIAERLAELMDWIERLPSR